MLSQKTPASRSPQLTSEQLALWLSEQLNPEANVNLIVRKYTLLGPLKEQALRISLDKILNRHDALRACVQWNRELPAQFLLAAKHFPLRTLEPGDNKDKIQEFCSHSINLFSELPCAGLLVNEGKDQSTLFLRFHHLFMDGVSLGVFLNELSREYRHIVSGASSRSVVPMAASFLDFASTSRLVEENSFPMCNETKLARICGFSLSQDERQKINQLAREHGSSPSALILAVFASILKSPFNDGRVQIGVPYANRQSSTFARTIGCFTKTVVFEARPQQENWKDKIRGASQFFFSLMRGGVKRKEESSIDALFVVRPPAAEQLDMGDIKVKGEGRTVYQSQFPLCLEWIAGPSSSELQWQYHCDEFSTTDIENLQDSLLASLAEIERELHQHV